MNKRKTVWKIKDNSTGEIRYSQNLNYVFKLMDKNQEILFKTDGKPAKLPYDLLELDINSVPKAELILYGDSSEST